MDSAKCIIGLTGDIAQTIMTACQEWKVEGRWNFIMELNLCKIMAILVIISVMLDNLDTYLLHQAVFRWFINVC